MCAKESRDHGGVARGRRLEGVWGDPGALQCRRGLRPWEHHGIIGPNGAGKTTLFNVITGFLAPDTGSVRLDGVELVGRSATSIVAAGIARTFQAGRLFESLTVFDNVAVAVGRQTGSRLSSALFFRWGVRRSERLVREKVESVLAATGLTAVQRALPSELSNAERRLLGIARILAADAQVLLLDEPLAGLDEVSIVQVTEALRSLRAEGRTIVLIEHNFEIIRSLSDVVVFMADGTLGVHRVGRRDRRPTRPRGVVLWPLTPPLLSISGIEAGYGKVEVLHGVSLEIGVGEVVGLVGHNGAGKTTLLRTISKQLRVTAGTISAAPGRKMPVIALVPQGRSLFADLTVAENLRLAGYVCPRPQRPERLNGVLETFPVLAERLSQIAGSMSGGQQQMLSIGIALMAQPELLLLDEPSLGLAPSVAEQVLGIVSRLRESGISILMVEQSVAAAARVVDRLVVLKSGDLVAQLDPQDVIRDPSALWAYF